MLKSRISSLGGFVASYGPGSTGLDPVDIPRFVFADAGAVLTELPWNSSFGVAVIREVDINCGAAEKHCC
jgi:hypothetical protein